MGNEFVEVPVAWVKELSKVVCEKWELVAFKKPVTWIRKFKVNILDISDKR